MTQVLLFAIVVGGALLIGALGTQLLRRLREVPTPLAELEERWALGQIDDHEYRKRRDLLIRGR